MCLPKGSTYPQHIFGFLLPRSAQKLEADRKDLLVLHDGIAALKAKFDADKELSKETLELLF